MLYETASRAAAVLDLNVEDLDFEKRRARITVKGGDVEWVVWGTGTARLLPRYLCGRQAGPLFLSDRRPGPSRRASTPRRAATCARKPAGCGSATTGHASSSSSTPGCTCTSCGTARQLTS